MNPLTALYSDGRYLASRPVEVKRSDDHRIEVDGAGFACTYPLEQVRASSPVGSIARFIYLPDGAVLESVDPHVDELLGHRRRESPFSRFIHILESHSGVAAAATLAVILLAAAVFHFGLPRLARHIAHQTPPTIDRQAGEAALVALQPYLPRSALDRRERARVFAQLQRLLPERATDELPRLEFRQMAADAANALALPGDILIVTDAFVTLANDDEIAAVLAHELGHLHHRHGLQSALRNSFALLFVTALTGDLSTLTSFAGTLPFLILNNGYSRDLEREADAFAHELLAARGIALQNFSNILVKLEEHNGGSTGAYYLSTHPSTAERLERFGPPDENARKEVVETMEDSEATEQSAVPPRVIRQVPPTYPLHLRRENIQGEVLVQFVVDRQGYVQEQEVLKSTHAGFDAAALTAVIQWKFEPGTRQGRPVNVRMQVPIIFSIEDDANAGAPEAPVAPEP